MVPGVYRVRRSSGIDTTTIWHAWWSGDKWGGGWVDAEHAYDRRDNGGTNKPRDYFMRLDLHPVLDDRGQPLPLKNGGNPPFNGVYRVSSNRPLKPGEQSYSHWDGKRWSGVFSSPEKAFHHRGDPAGYQVHSWSTDGPLAVAMTIPLSTEGITGNSVLKGSEEQLVAYNTTFDMKSITAARRPSRNKRLLLLP